MEVQQDFKELLALFNDHRVSYVIVGGYALAFHGAPRFTGDLDIFVKPDGENAGRIVAALGAFGFASLGLAIPDQVIQLGVAPVRVDIITSITGLSWQEVFVSRVPSNYGDVPVNYIGREELILNKRAVGRAKDLADLEALGEK